MPTATTTRRRSRATEVELPSAEELRRLKLSPEVAWYLITRGIPLPTCPPLIKTPEPGELLKSARFDPERVDKVIRSFERLRHTQGPLAGKALRPDPWQVAYVLAPVFGWVRYDRKHRQWVRVIRSCFIEVPRKNGKSTLAGGLALYLTCADGEQGAQVLTAAISERTAGYVFNPIKQLAKSSRSVKPYVRALAKKIIHRATSSYVEVVSSKAGAEHGGNIHGAIVDELHLHKSPDVVDAIETGTGSRIQPLIIFITTADDGRPGTIYALKRKRIEQLAKRLFRHPATYGVVFAAEETDDPFSLDTLRKANPGFGISPTREYLEDQAAAARQTPAMLSRYLRLHLGIRVRQEARWIKLPDWDHSAGMVDERKLYRGSGRRAFGGIDLASVEDLAAVCWEFPDDQDGADVIWRFWLPEERITDLNWRTAGEADTWVREGLLQLTPGNVIDLARIEAAIVDDARHFEVATIGYDRWSANPLVTNLQDEGLTLVPRGQGFATASAPMKDVLRMVLAKRYRHGGNPIMRWMTDNLTVSMDAAGNVKPDKSKAADKIDGWSALVTAHGEVMDNAATKDEEQPPPAEPQVAINAQLSETSDLAEVGF